MKKFIFLLSFTILFLAFTTPILAAHCAVENDPVPPGNGAKIRAEGLNDVEHLIRINALFDPNVYTHACGRPQNGTLRLTSTELIRPGSYVAFVAPKRRGPCQIASSKPSNTVATCHFKVGTEAEAGKYEPCGIDSTKPWYNECMDCITPKDGIGKYEDGGSWTALGCIPNNPRELAVWVLGRAIGIGGGIAFLLMIWGGFQVITAAGDPDRLNAGKEIITSAIAGLLLIIFSLFLLELIGVDILGLGEVGFKIGQ